MGELRNGLIVRAGDAVIAVGGAFGTLSEVALALKTGVPVVGLGTWELMRGGAPIEPDPVVRVATATEAVATALRLARP
jgi:predicted Rossmann-fold nucleotide-binding protein